MVHGERRRSASGSESSRKVASTFSRAVIEGFAYDYHRSPAGMLKTMSEGEIGELWEWLLAQYPLAEDPDRERGGTVTTRWAMANLRDSLVSHLADIGTVAGCHELQRLIRMYPRFSLLPRVLSRAQEQTRRHTWQPTTPNDLFQLAACRRSRLVQCGDQLIEVIIDSLDGMQRRLRGETPMAQFLWNGEKHRSEESISEWIKVHLEDDLKQRGVVLNREVQIHRFDRTDIHVTALTQTDNEVFGNVKVIIEVKRVMEYPTEDFDESPVGRAIPHGQRLPSRLVPGCLVSKTAGLAPGNIETSVTFQSSANWRPSLPNRQRRFLQRWPDNPAEVDRFFSLRRSATKRKMPRDQR